MSTPETNVIVELEVGSIKVVVSALEIDTVKAVVSSVVIAPTVVVICVIAVVCIAVCVAVSAVVRGYAMVSAVLITAEVAVAPWYQLGLVPSEIGRLCADLLTFIDNISGISPTVIFGNKIQKKFLVTSDVTSDIWTVTSYVTDRSPVGVYVHGRLSCL